MLVGLSGCTTAVSSAPAATPTPTPSHEPPVLVRPSSVAASTPVLRVAYLDEQPGYAVLWVAQAAQVFQRHDLQVTLTHLSEPALLAALQADELDVVVASGVTALKAHAAGTPVRLVAGLLNVLPYQLLVGPAVERAADLRGTRVALGRPGSPVDVATRLALDELRLELGSEVLPLQIGATAERLAALENGAVQAAVALPHEATWLEPLGFYPLVDLTAGPEFPAVQVVVLDRLVRERPRVVQQLVTALIDATALAKRERDLTRRVLRDHLGGSDEASLDATYTTFVQKLAPRTPYPARASLPRLWQVIAEQEPTAPRLDPQTLADDRFVRQAIESGYVNQLYPASSINP